MRLGDFLQTWRGVQAANRWLWLAVLLLATAKLLAWLHQPVGWGEERILSANSLEGR